MSDPVTIASAVGVALTALGTIYATRTANQAKRGDHVQEEHALAASIIAEGA